MKNSEKIIIMSGKFLEYRIHYHIHIQIVYSSSFKNMEKKVLYSFELFLLFFNVLSKVYIFLFFF